MNPAPSHIRSILVLRYSALGDVVLATSILDPLKALFPDARIEWVVDTAYAGLLEGLPQVARVHGFEPRRKGTLRAVLREVQGRFDLAIDLQNKLWMRVIALAAADRTVRFVKRTPRDVVLSLLGRDPVMERAHATQLYAEALAPLGVTGPGRVQLSLSERAIREADALLRDVARAPVGIAPGARWATKQWPPERFAEVANALHAQGHPIVLVGGPGNADVLERFRRAVKGPLAADLTGLSVDGLAGAIRRLKLLVACDSGPVHLATALGVPSVVVFGPTSVKRWGPPTPSRAVSLPLPCSPCTNHGSSVCPLKHHRCMGELQVQAVMDAVTGLMSETCRETEAMTADR